MKISFHRPFKVGLLAYKVIGLICLGFFIYLGVNTYYERDYIGVMVGCFFALMGLCMLMVAGVFVLDDDGVSHKNLFGHYRMAWRDVQSIEYGIYSMVLHGKGKRFSLPSYVLWSGADRHQARDLQKRKFKEFEERDVEQYDNKYADFKYHKNVKVRDTTA
jgi:hypothetical protein